MRALSQLFDATTLVLPLGESSGQEGELPLEGHNLNVVPVTFLAGQGSARKARFPFWTLRNFPVLFREARRADAIHAPIPGDIGTAGMFLAVALRKPLFVRHCGNWFKPRTIAEHFWKSFMERFAGGRNVMLATGGAPFPPSKGNPHLRWIFSTSLTAAEMERYGSRRELEAPVRLIIVCRQEWDKGTRLVIESLPLIEKQFPEVRLDVVGEGTALPKLVQRSQAADVRDRVCFHGRVNHAQVMKLLRQADLFCYPTLASEGFPKVVLEALACGLPVITTRVSVLPELIGDNCGILLKEATPQAVGQAIIAALSDSEQYARMSRQAISTARRFSLERWQEQIGSHLKEAWGALRCHA